jgi:hypothetical protein
MQMTLAIDDEQDVFTKYGGYFQRSDHDQVLAKCLNRLGLEA